MAGQVEKTQQKKRGVCHCFPEVCDGRDKKDENEASGFRWAPPTISHTRKSRSLLMALPSIQTSRNPSDESIDTIASAASRFDLAKEMQ